MSQKQVDQERLSETSVDALIKKEGEKIKATHWSRIEPLPQKEVRPPC